MGNRARPIADCLVPRSGGLLNPAEAQAGGADLQTDGLAVDDRPHLLQIRLEAALDAAGDLAADAALGLGQAAPPDLLTAERTLVAERAPATFGHGLDH